MRNVELVSLDERVSEIEALYGRFDIGLDGLPTPAWEGRNIRAIRMPEMLRHASFPGVYLQKVRGNRRMMGALQRVYIDIWGQWNDAERKAHGLNQFVKCYCFGDGSRPNLFWYGAAWEISAQVGGEVFTEAVKLFQKHGFTHDRKRLRIFEYW
jgi:hypothetical protein